MRRLNDLELTCYDHIPGDVAVRIRIASVPFLIFGADGMTIDRFVLLRRDAPIDRTGERELLAHELVHARQWAELGVGRFLWRYLVAYARNLTRFHHHGEAYLAIPLEVEAREEAARWAQPRPHPRASD